MTKKRMPGDPPRPRRAPRTERQKAIRRVKLRAKLKDPVWGDKKRAYYRGRLKARNKDVNWWFRRRLNTIRKRARDNDIPFDISPEDFTMPDVCPITGLPFVLGMGVWNPQTPSFDRKIPELGYVKGNVFIISWLANRLKGECTDPEVFRAIARYLEDKS